MAAVCPRLDKPVDAYEYPDADDAADDAVEDPTMPLVLPPPPPPPGSSVLTLNEYLASATQSHGAAAAAVPRSNKRGRAPASSKAIEGLREVTAAADGSDDCCAICLQDLDARPDPEAPAPGLRAMLCSHTFHQRCISEWLRRNAVCPLCRYKLPTEEEEEEEEDNQLEQGRFGRRRIVYDQEDGRYYLVSRMAEDPPWITEEEEQELDQLNATTPQS